MRVLALIWTLSAGWVSAHAAILVEDVSLVAAESSVASRGFQIAQSGRYELRLSDVGLPAPLTSLKAMITRGDQRIAVLSAPGAIQFDATAGDYELQIAGVASAAAKFGSFAARVVPVAGGSDALDYSDTVTSPGAAAPAGRTTAQTQAAIGSTGTYRIALTDLAFPEDLTNVDVLLTRGGVQLARLSKTSPSVDFSGTAGSYDLLMVAQAAAATNAGLFNVRIVELANGATTFDSSVPVGRLGPSLTIELPASAPYSLKVADLQFPAALSSAVAAVVRGSQLLARQTGSGTLAFNAPAGSAQLYALPTPAAPSTVGAMSVDLLQGNARVSYDVFRASPFTTSSGISLYEAHFTPPAAGSHRATLTDFEFPETFGDLQIALFQNGQELGRRTGTGSFDIQAGTGPATILVAATPGGAGSGLFGLQVAAQSGEVVFEATQAAGAIFESRSVDISSAGSYDIRVSDLEFPARFQELATALTRGTKRVGFVFGGGTFTFDATPGTYFLNFITRIDPVQQFGSYGLTLQTTPPPPEVTLAATPTSVTSGGSSTLNWASIGATSCVASGQWAGSKAVSGSQSVGPLTVDSTFTLTCSGVGGSTAKSVTVTLRSAKGNGGGGAIDPATLLLLLLLLCAASLAKSVRVAGRSRTA